VNAVPMVAHCMQHQSATERPYCDDCGAGGVISENLWYCPECLAVLERRECPYCAM
jgi:hypothetical protein